ncbi:hypothetical protein EMIHUDRAFT_224452 [Emiliania huxleyi CCMP1516]|uniref:CAF17 C-terminal domain-containing protein n=3 Tax=Emiliania huxleyi TaxID=2903 RepID=A0A0D3KSB5_EMIH1|nr:hypothetical protein EMIHUDRAFT_224452 [Emiliania huxleyi CCMP1516]EOD38650.1 hypothetical protein EMIHUDRAFT_224452 [Emiliania huxleyi CCMP1516]|eukprot:XP_005791079.1 hypothetical protein EMIHUDRAFT_224452 [Emiliania huxleyi CCMP1516]
MLRYLASSRWHATLADRAVLSLTGADSRKLLQGLTTANADELAAGTPLYTGFLNAQGRVLATGFLLPASEDGVVIDTHVGSAPLLLKHLKRYKLRSKVAIADRSAELAVVAACGTAVPLEPADGVALPGDGGAWRDPRLRCLGWRGVAPRADGGDAQPPAELLGGAGGGEGSSEAAPAALHALCEAILGVGDGPAYLPPTEALPLESNLEVLGGVAFDKGCYLGQELTARTQSRGVTRKRMAPLVSASVAAALGPPPPEDVLPAALSHLPAAERALAAALPVEAWLEAQPGGGTPEGAGSALQDAAGKPAGKLRLFDSALGLGAALCRLEAMGGGVLTAEEAGEVVPLRPSWWPAGVH